jgi:glycosyltransferase involved in cell wall biosynthesis
MHIGLIIYEASDMVSGGYLYDSLLVKHLRAMGETVSIVRLPWPTYLRSLSQNNDKTIRQKLADLPVDILLQDELCHPSLYRLNRWLKPRLSAPIVSIVHHLRSSEEHPALWLLLYQAIERAYLRSVDAFIYNSKTTRQTVESGIGPTTAIVAPPSGSRFKGLGKPTIRARARQDRPLRIVYVGNVIERKGLHTLLAALSRLPEGIAHLTVVGSLTADPAYARRIRSLIARWNLGEQVVLTGSLPDAEMRTHLAGADVLCVPSQYEGFGIIYLEGMAFGLPAIGSTGGAAPEIITDGETGFLVPPGDPDALATCLHSLAIDRAHLLRMSLTAHSRASAWPTWEDSLRSVHAFLQSLKSVG